MGRGVALRTGALLLVLALAPACAPAPGSRAPVATPAPSILPAGADVPNEAPAGDIAVAAPEVFTGEPPAPANPPPQLQAPPTRESAASGRGVWAVVVGIDDYPGRGNDLRSAGNDAEDMDRALARYGVPAPQRLRLMGGAATASNLRRSLEWLVANAGPDAIAVFFYAGHVRKVRGQEALVGADGGTVLDLEVADLLRPLAARRAWLVVAGCYGGGFTEALAPGRILTGAAPADQLAYESPQLGRSYLVEYLVRRAMLQGLADQSVEAAYAWALSALRREHPGRLPVQFDDLAGDLSLRSGEVLPPDPPGPPPQARRAAPATTTTAPPTTTTSSPPCLVTSLSARCRD